MFEQTPTQKVIDLRHRIQQNKLAGKPDLEGITKDELKEAVLYLRVQRAGSASSAAEKREAAEAATMPLDDLLETLSKK